MVLTKKKSEKIILVRLRLSSIGMERTTFTERKAPNPSPRGRYFPRLWGVRRSRLRFSAQENPNPNKQIKSTHHSSHRVVGSSDRVGGSSHRVGGSSHRVGGSSHRVGAPNLGVVATLPFVTNFTHETFRSKCYQQITQRKKKKKKKKKKEK